MILGWYLWPSMYSQSCCSPYLTLHSLHLSPAIKSDAIGYLDMKDAHKKHISLGYGFQLCVLLQAPWKSS